MKVIGETNPLAREIYKDNVNHVQGPDGKIEGMGSSKQSEA